MLVDTATGLYRLATDPVETGNGIANTLLSADTLIYNGFMKSELDTVLGDYESVTARDFEFIGGLTGSGAITSKAGKAAWDRFGKKSSEVTSDVTKIDNPTSNTNIKHNGNSGSDGVGEGIETYKRVNNNADLIKDIIENANIQSYTHKQIIRTLEDGTKIIIRKDFGENAHNLGKPFNEKMDHYNLEIQVPFKNGYKTIENIHIVPTEKGYIWYGKDKIIKGE